MFLCSVVKDSDYKNSLKYNKKPFITVPRIFTVSKEDVFTGYHNTGNANL